MHRQLLWLQEFTVVQLGNPGVFDLFDLGGVRILHDLRAALERSSPTTAAEDLFFERERALVSYMRRAGRLDVAMQVLDELVIPRSGPGHPQWSSICVDAASVHRRAFRWSEAQAWLERASAAAMTDEQRLFVAVGRASLAFERGLPDLAAAAVAEAEELARDTENALAVHAATFASLRLDTVLDRKAEAIARFEAFAAGPAAAWLEREGFTGRTEQLAIRAAMAVLQDPDAAASDAARATGWLDAALLSDTTSVDEKRLARNVKLAWLLDQGRLDDAAGLLAEAEADLSALADSGAALNERSLHLAALAVRHASLAGSQPGVLAERCEALRSLFDEMLARWAEQPAGRSGVGPLFFADRRMALAELIGATVALRREPEPESAALQHVIRAQSLGSLARELGAGEVTAAEVRSTLAGPERGVLVFVPGAAASHVFAVAADRTRHSRIEAGAFTIDRLRRRLLVAMQAVRGGSGGAALRGELADARARLSRALLPDSVREALSGWRHVTVVGLESLGYLPFEYLESSDGRALGIARSVGYLPSLPVGVWLARERPARAPRPAGQGRVLLAACPDLVLADPPRGFSPLPFGAAEKAQLADGLEAARVGWLTGGEAAFDRILALDPADHDVLQILAHGVRDEHRDDPQGVALPGGHLWGPDLERRALPGLVVLTACRAGRGRLRRGDDGRHLWSGAALVGGARAVVLPWLEVDYRATLAFSAAMHGELFGAGVAVEEALRRARARCLADDPEAIDPFLFHLVGLGEAPLAEPAPRSRAVAWWLLALAVALAPLLLWRRLSRRRGE